MAQQFRPSPGRSTARAVTRGTVVVTVNASGPSGTLQPRMTIAVPRRTGARVIWLRVLGPGNASGPSGTLQPRAAIPVPRRTGARAVWAHFTGPGNASGPSGTVQARAAVPVPRRGTARAVTRGTIPVVVNASGPTGTLQPRMTVAVPRRYPARAAQRSVINRLTVLALPVPVTVISGAPGGGTISGVTLPATAANPVTGYAGVSVPNNGLAVVYFTTGAGSAPAVSFVVQLNVLGEYPAPFTQALSPSGAYLFGPFPVSKFNDPGGLLQITFSGTLSGTYISVYQLPAVAV